MLNRPAIAYRCDDSLPGILCCIFESYTRKEYPVTILDWEEPSLFPARAVETNEENALRVWRSIEKSPETALLVRDFWFSCVSGRAVLLFSFIRLFYELGASVCVRFHDPVCSAVLKAAQAVRHEAHLFTGFVRFSEREGVLVSEISPKGIVLPLIAPHFTDRFAGESFVIFDQTHRQALFYRQGNCELQELDSLSLSCASDAERMFESLWKQYYRSITITERINPRCRMTHMPKRFWAQMLEVVAELPPPPRQKLLE